MFRFEWRIAWRVVKDGYKTRVKPCKRGTGWRGIDGTGRIEEEAVRVAYYASYNVSCSGSIKHVIVNGLCCINSWAWSAGWRICRWEISEWRDWACETRKDCLVKTLKAYEVKKKKFENELLGKGIVLKNDTVFNKSEKERTFSEKENRLIMEMEKEFLCYKLQTTTSGCRITVQLLKNILAV